VQLLTLSTQMHSVTNGQTDDIIMMSRAYHTNKPVGDWFAR